MYTLTPKRVFSVPVDASQITPHQFEDNGQIVAKGRWSLQIPGRTITKKYPDGSEETVRFEGFQIVKEQFGSSEIKRYSKEVKNKQGIILHKAGDVIDLGDDYKGAGTDAFKKCCTELGMFLDVYSRRSAEEEGGVSKEQYKVFYWRAEQAGLDTEEKAEKWASEQLDKPFKDADQLEVMGLIPALIDLAKAKGDAGS